MTINNKKVVANKPLLAYTLKVANKVKKLDRKDGNIDLLAASIITMFMKDAVNYKANVIINKTIRDNESVMKDEIIENYFKEGRQTGKIFYIASSHKDSAEDHKPYQGKIYVDAYYNRHNQELIDYVKNNNIRTVQWVTGKPVYFITRPHCRHYFVAYTFDEIKGGRYHIPKRKVGDKEMQTPRDANIEYYEDRLKMLQALYKVKPTEKLKAHILKTKILISKWKKVK